MHRCTIGIAEDSYRSDTQFLTGTDNPNSDFAPIGDQNFFYGLNN